MTGGGGPRPFLVGLTGGLASGKSTVAGWLRDAGFLVVDADRVVAELYWPGRPGADAVRELLGEAYLGPDGAVDHRRLAAKIFHDDEARQRLEAKIHPLVRAVFERMAREAAGVAVLEATLLVEAGFAPDFDLVVTVEADPQTRLRRAVERGLDEAAARRRLEAQGDGEARRTAAHRVLRNDRALEELRTAVDELVAEIRERAGRSGGPLEGVVFVTGNANKLEEARRLCGADLEAAELDLPEIQSLDLETVLRAKGDEAWRRLGRPLIVEETGLELAALNGFPGPLVKWMLQAVGAEGIARTALALESPGVIARCLLLYRDAERSVIGEGATTGSLTLPARGESGFGWDPVFQPREFDQTYAEMSGEEKDRIGHRGRAWRDLLGRLR